jgi:hypothetical protein
MSTTNPEHGRPPADPVGGLAPVRPGTPLADDHDVSGPPAADTIARGHELDAYDSTSVFSVPLLVVLFFVLAFVTVSVLFYFLFPSPVDPGAHPKAVAYNKQDVSKRYNVAGTKLDNFRDLGGSPFSITSTEQSTGNSRWIQPDDLRVNPANTPPFYQAGWVEPGKTHARITIDDALELAAADGGKAILPVNPAADKEQGRADLPTAANAGRTPPPKTPAAAPVGKKPEEKKPEEKKPEEKKPEEKKDQPKADGKKPEDKKPADGKAGEGKK